MHYALVNIISDKWYNFQEAAAAPELLGKDNLLVFILNFFCG